jgi:acyl carrier protein
MTTTSFTVPDLMDMLTVKAGLPAQAHTSDPDETLIGIGLDSLAFLAVQTELVDRYGFELPYDKPVDGYTVGEMAGDIDTRLRATSGSSGGL